MKEILTISLLVFSGVAHSGIPSFSEQAIWAAYSLDKEGIEAYEITTIDFPCSISYTSLATVNGQVALKYNKYESIENAEHCKLRQAYEKLTLDTLEQQLNQEDPNRRLEVLKKYYKF
ncbi:hypothetical protein ACNO5M_17415 [Vibrio owensii]|uniref:hypothetical protein n=1 Tax=Vibrio harveyi group TaxID=717610 RepID=UPI000CE3F4F1|nr:hypothetical protein [Vibrio jasicida]